MHARSWISLLLLDAAVALAGCGDDTVVPADDSTSGTDGSTTTPMTTGATGSDDGVDESTGAVTTTGPMMGCGDGTIEDDVEACDDGNTEDGDGCSATCTVEEGFACAGEPSTCTVDCGDGLVRGDEQCDDDNDGDEDGCSPACELETGWACEGEPSVCGAVCGDGMSVNGEEDCDDGNAEPGDGCNENCLIESGFFCGQMPSVCETICGDGLVAGAEECDDAALVDGDGCSVTCTVELGWSCGMEPSECMTGCGDGIVVGMEQCDDMGLADGDGCSAICELEEGYVCAGSPSACETLCGDGLIAGMEQCDDLDMADGDGCSAACQIETGFVCQSEPSDCFTQCGDGQLAGEETCDDGNFNPGDGCSLVCQDEFGWDCVGLPSACALTEVLAEVRLGIDGGCVLSTMGDLGCFGFNSQGEVGIGVEDVEVHLPAFALDDVVSFDSGEEFNCAVRAGGSVWCWGDNSGLQLGPLGSGTTDEYMPIEVTGMPAIAQIRTGDDHACALDVMGGVWCWGDNIGRQLGRGANTTDSPIPQLVPMPGGLAAVSLGMGDDHSCAVLSDGTAACWGDDDNGQQGDGASGTDNGDAVLVTGAANVAQIEGGSDHTCLRTNAGELYCWGDNDNGQLGDGTGNDHPLPTLVMLPAAVEDVSLGDEFTCALLVDDTAWCWGEGSDFQLGNGDLVDATAPTPVLDMPAADLVDIEVGGRGACLTSATNERYCWGYSETGLLGIAPLNQVQPSPVNFSGPVQQLVVSPPEYRGVLCGVLGDGSVECSGDGTVVLTSTSTGAQGLFEPISWHLADPTPMPQLSNVQDMDIGDGFACVATPVDVQCWGDNLARQLGQGGVSTTDILTPSPVVGLGMVDQLELGAQFACVRTGGQVQCWGDNISLQTGEGAVTTDQSVPVQVLGLADAVDIALGDDHACALRATGVVSCWGEDDSGQLGDDDGDTADSAVPVDVTGLPAMVMVDQVVVGQDHSCALAAGEVYCWGEGGYGNLGQDNELDSDTALLVPGLSGITQLSAGYNYTCALDGVGDMWCWGYALDGQLGDGGEERTGNSEVRSPTPFIAASGITNVATANAMTCVEVGGQWGCLGFTASGQLGNGTSVEPATPMLMVFGL